MFRFKDMESSDAACNLADNAEQLRFDHVVASSHSTTVRDAISCDAKSRLLSESQLFVANDGIASR